MEFLAQHAVEALNSEAKRRRLESSPQGTVGAPLELSRDPASLATFTGVYTQQNDDTSSDRGGRTDPAEEDGDDDDIKNGLKTKKRKQKSMYKGVFKCGKKFKAQIQTHGVQHYLGLYDTEEEAARAYDNHARFVLGAKAKTNFPYDSRDLAAQSFIPAMSNSIPTRPAPASLTTASVAPPNSNPAIPPALVGSSTAGSSAGEEEDENGMNRQPLKRSYVGMKVRKKNQKELIEANKKTMMSIPPPINFMPHFSGVPTGDLTGQTGVGNKLIAPSQAQFGHTLIHLPVPLAQSPFLMNSLPNGYTPVLHPLRYASGFPQTMDGRLPSVPSLASSLTNNFGNNPAAATSSNASTIHDLAAAAAGVLPPSTSSIPQSIQNYSSRRDLLQTSQQFHDQRISNSSLPASLSNREAPRIDWSKHALEITGAYPYTAVPLTQSEPDWREQIYYWTGKLAFDESKSCLSWKGHWLGSFTGKPSREEFASSMNEFSYFSQRVERSRAFTNEGLLRPLPGSYKGSYNMDNDGTGEMEQYNDKEFFIEFEDILGMATPRYHVYGKGDSEFGVFILHGSYDAITRVLEMDRQYLAENDLRKTMSLMQLKLHFKRQLA